MQKIDLIKYPLITEKTTDLYEKNQYTFIVDKKSTKKDLKKVAEYLFNVSIKKINIQKQPVKIKRIRLKKGYKPGYKKAIFHVNKNDKINIFVN